MHGGEQSVQVPNGSGRGNEPVRATSLISMVVLAASAATVARAAVAAPAPTPARSVRKITVAVIPAQWFTADAESAQRLTEGIRRDFASRGWRVLSDTTVQTAAGAMGLKNGVHYPDAAILHLGRTLHADVVVYPRLLTMGLPVTALSAQARIMDPAAVLHVRVLDVTRKQAVYCNQVAHPFNGDGAASVKGFALSASESRVAAARALGGFFTPRVAGVARLRLAQVR